MNNVARVAVVNRGKDLLSDVGGIALTEVLLLRDPLEQLASVAKPTIV